MQINKIYFWHGNLIQNKETKRKELIDRRLITASAEFYRYISYSMLSFSQIACSMDVRLFLNIVFV